VLAERLTKPGARGHAAHGLTPDQAEDLARQLSAAGFVRAAIDAGLRKSEVHRLTGMARTTIDRIAGTLPAMEADPR
jgi:hypothetical protein